MGLGLEGRNVVLTGGTGALGAAVTAKLLEHGAICHIPCFKKQELDNFAFTQHERVRLTIGIDLTDEHAVELFYSIFAGGRSVPLWASIHLAGGFAMTPIEKARKADLLRQLETNLVTAFLCSREAVRRMREGGEHDAGAAGKGHGGRIVNVAARPVLEPRCAAGMTTYVAAKAAVAAFTQALSEETAIDGIWVNAIVPSLIDTPANREAMPKADFSRWPKCDQLADTIAFLASPQNAVSRGGLIPAYGRA